MHFVDLFLCQYSFFPPYLYYALCAVNIILPAFLFREMVACENINYSFLLVYYKSFTKKYL